MRRCRRVSARCCVTWSMAPRTTRSGLGWASAPAPWSRTCAASSTAGRRLPYRARGRAPCARAGWKRSADVCGAPRVASSKTKAERTRAQTSSVAPGETHDGGARPHSPLVAWGATRLLRNMNLGQLAAEFGSDKWGVHYYTPHYERHLAHLRKERCTLLEIGIGGRTPSTTSATLRPLAGGRIPSTSARRSPSAPIGPGESLLRGSKPRASTRKPDGGHARLTSMATQRTRRFLCLTALAVITVALAACAPRGQLDPPRDQINPRESERGAEEGNIGQPPGAPPPVIVRAGDKRFELTAWTYCFGNG